MLTEESDERRYTSRSRLIRGWRMTGSAFRCWTLCLGLAKRSRGEVRRGDTCRECVWQDPGGLLPNHIYIYIRKLNFLGSLFWRGFGEVLERDLGDQKLQKHCVLQCFLIATIKIPKVFLGFSSSGERSGSPKYWKYCVLQWFLIATIEQPIFTIGFSMFFSSGDLLSIIFFIVCCNGRLTSN